MIYGGMPPTIQAEYRTPEELGAFFYAAWMLLRSG